MTKQDTFTELKNNLFCKQIGKQGTKTKHDERNMTETNMTNFSNLNKLDRKNRLTDKSGRRTEYTKPENKLDIIDRHHSMTKHVTYTELTKK